MSKRILAMFLAVLMIVSMFPVSAFADVDETVVVDELSAPTVIDAITETPEEELSEIVEEIPEELSEIVEEIPEELSEIVEEIPEELSEIVEPSLRLKETPEAGAEFVTLVLENFPDGVSYLLAKDGADAVPLTDEDYTSEDCEITFAVEAGTYCFSVVGEEGVIAELYFVIDAAEEEAEASEDELLALDGATYTYVDDKGRPKELTSGVTEITQNTTSWSGWMYASGTVTINSDVTLSGNTDLILADNAVLTVNGSISGSGKNLTVYVQNNGNGKLTVTKNISNNVATGVQSYNFTVNGGSVNIKGQCTGSWAAYGVNGSVIVNGGSVEISGLSGTGNGFGVFSGTVTVNGGSVKITGGGSGSIAYGVNGTAVTVSGGTVEIVGDCSANGYGAFGNITVSGGTVDITGTGSSEGIGLQGTSKNITVTGDGVLKLHGNTKATNEPAKVNAKVETSTDGSTWVDWTDSPALSTFTHLRMTDAHTHAFTYGASGATLTATCTAGCSKGYDKTPLSITLTGDVDADAAAVKAWNDAGAATATLSYYAAGDTTTPVEPFASGKYVAKASVTYGDTPTTVTATKEIDYVSPYYYINDKNEKVELETMPTIVTSTTTTLAADGWYFVKGNVTINGSVTLANNVNLILADGASLEITDGITSSSKKALTVYAQTLGTGALTVTKTAEASSVFCVKNIDVTVNGGNVTVAGTNTKTDGSDYGVNGSVTVNGGSVRITGTSTGGNGSGIGVSGSVTVSGGSVEIKSIGALASNGVYNGSVTISGGSVTITGTSPKQGIGVADKNGKTITVNGGGLLLNGSTQATNVTAANVDAKVQYSDTDNGNAYDKTWDGKSQLTQKYLKLTQGTVAELTHDGVATKYKTLAEAIAAAQDGDTIKLLSNAKGDGIVIPEGTFTTGLTIDLGGFTYTVDGALVGSTNTQTNGFQFLKGNKITMSNGTINVGDNAAGKTADGEVKNAASSFRIIPTSRWTA